MKRLTITLAALLSSFLFFSCNNTPKENTSKTNVISTEEKDHHSHENETIALNKGEKWKVDDNMMVHIQNIQNDVKMFSAKNASDYATLAKKISDNLERLTSNCTMEGEAHDELHKWLLPFLDLSEKFSESKSEKESAENFQKIETSLVTFNQYFK